MLKSKAKLKKTKEEANNMYEQSRELSLDELEQVTGGVDCVICQKDILDQIEHMAENLNIPTGAIDITEFLSNHQ